MIIRSMIDDDLYKLTMSQAVWARYPDAEVEYRFINRGEQHFTSEFLSALREELRAMASLALTGKELAFLRGTGYFREGFLRFFADFRYDPKEVATDLDDAGNLDIRIRGRWARTIFWEVKLMAVISELYFRLIERSWSMAGQEEQAQRKLGELQLANARFAEFGTRRRRNFATQDLLVRTFAANAKDELFLGTSNVYLAMRYGVPPVGTTAHEWFQGVSALESLNHANRDALNAWLDVYAGVQIPLTALTDTFTTDAFLRDFERQLAQAYGSARHDSGCPFAFMDKMIAFYQSQGIDPRGKSLIFSDGLNVEKAVAIQRYARGRIGSVFGIGTHLTNDFADSPALNMVIKLFRVDDTPVVKLSDVPGKASGDADAVRVARWIHTGCPLDDRKCA